MTTDDLYDMVRTFRAEHDLPDPRYVTLHKAGPGFSMHFDADASALRLDVPWHFLSSSNGKPTMSANTRHAGAVVSLIAPYGEVSA